PRLAHRGIPRTREEAAGLTAAPELGTGPEDHEHAFQGRQPSLTPTLQGDEGRLSDLNEGGEFALTHPPVAAEPRQPLAQRGAGREVAADELEVGVPIVTEKKPTNLVRGPGSTVFFLLETRLRGLDSRNRLREYLSRTKGPRNPAV